MIIEINLLTVAIGICVIGVIALGVYIARQILRDGDEAYDADWMDYEKWRQSK